MCWFENIFAMIRNIYFYWNGIFVLYHFRMTWVIRVRVISSKSHEFENKYDEDDGVYARVKLSSSPCTGLKWKMKVICKACARCLYGYR